MRERKYEVGVLTAMGMKKWKVATQFICEILVVTMIAVIVGAGIGAVSSVPATNALLAGQVESQNNQQTQMDNNFGRPGNMGGGHGGMRPGGNQGSATPTTTDTVSMKGIKAANSILISGGTFQIDSADDSIHSDVSVTINGGTFTIASGDDAVHAEETLQVRSIFPKAMRAWKP